jgi:hypothetical protein
MGIIYNMVFSVCSLVLALPLEDLRGPCMIECVKRVPMGIKRDHLKYVFQVMVAGWKLII